MQKYIIFDVFLYKTVGFELSVNFHNFRVVGSGSEDIKVQTIYKNIKVQTWINIATIEGGKRFPAIVEKALITWQF